MNSSRTVHDHWTFSSTSARSTSGAANPPTLAVFPDVRSTPSITKAPPGTSAPRQAVGIYKASRTPSAGTEAARGGRVRLHDPLHVVQVLRHVVDDRADDPAHHRLVAGQGRARARVLRLVLTIGTNQVGVAPGVQRRQH